MYKVIQNLVGNARSTSNIEILKGFQFEALRMSALYQVHYDTIRNDLQMPSVKDLSNDKTTDQQKTKWRFETYTCRIDFKSYWFLR